MASGSEGFKKINQNRKAGKGKPSPAVERYSRRRNEAIARNSANFEPAPF